MAAKAKARGLATKGAAGQKPKISRAMPTGSMLKCDHLGLGLQFAACAARILQLAEEKGLGKELPTEWFAQDEHS